MYRPLRRKGEEGEIGRKKKDSFKQYFFSPFP